MPRFVVTGTDTDIGKTVFAAGLAGMLDAHYWKPIQAGIEGGTDSARVHKLGVAAERVVPEVYLLKTPCSPHQAAAIDGVRIDLAALAPPDVPGDLVIEGAGGVLVPISPEILYADLLADWKIPAILVASTRLGTINHSLLSLEALRSRGVPIHGVAFVGDEQEITERTICAIGHVRRLGRLPMLDEVDAESLSKAFRHAFQPADFA